MVETWSTRAGLYAIFAAIAVIAAGCSHVATVPEADDPEQLSQQQLDQEQLDEDSLEAVELDPAVTKLDEADIGVSGPEQIEEAIETLDAQTE
jgi:PBP1b-binding outer membrane lipoprotein LpoB